MQHNKLPRLVEDLLSPFLSPSSSLPALRSRIAKERESLARDLKQEFELLVRHLKSARKKARDIKGYDEALAAVDTLLTKKR